MDAFCEAWASKRHQRDLHIRWKEMHTHMGETEMKEEEERLKQCEKSSQKTGGKLRIQEEQLKKT
jgi:hypothetical protein